MRNKIELSNGGFLEIKNKDRKCTNCIFSVEKKCTNRFNIDGCFRDGMNGIYFLHEDVLKNCSDELVEVINWSLLRGHPF